MSAPPPPGSACDTCKAFIPYGNASAFPSHLDRPLCLSCLDKALPPAPERTVVCTCPAATFTKPHGGDALLTALGFEFYTYKEGQKLQKQGKFPGQQLEHILPNSSHVASPGRRSDSVLGAEDYCEADALVYPIGDDQSFGTEHKFITDYERAVDQYLHANEQYATLRAKVALMVPGWEKMMLAFRGSKLPADKRQNARTAAIALGNRYLEHSVNVLQIDPGTPLRNGLVGAKSAAPTAALEDEEMFDAEGL